MSTGWLGRHWGMSEGSVVARHEVIKSFLSMDSGRTLTMLFQWKGLSKLSNNLKDYVERQKLERAERAQRRAQRRDAMPGTFVAEVSDEDTEMEDL